MNALTRAERALVESAEPAVSFTLNGREVSAQPGESLLKVAQREGFDVPHLCYKDGLEPAGNCRACMVEIQGERVLAPSCCRYPAAGMQVQTESERARRAQRTVLELLQSDMPEAEYTRHNELDQWAARLEVGKPRFAPRERVAADLSHPAIAVNLDACIQCTRCLRACRDEQVNDVIGLALRGDDARIVFDMDDPMGASTCVACGECVQACPTGALMPARDAALAVPDKQVESVCPYCGVGCQLTYNVKDNRILFVEGRDGPANHQRLCVKGRYGFDYVQHPQRLTVPLVRRDGVPKQGDFVMDPDHVMDVFREASWEEALALAGGKLAQIRDTHGKRALAGFGSAKGSNEEAYLFQKLVRTGFGSNNVDHCTRLCHASSVAALLEGIGSGAVSNPVMDVDKAEVVIVIGANPTVNHPVAASWIKNAVKNGTKLIVADPRRSDLARFAWRFLQFKPDADVALLNAMMHVIVNEGLVDQDFIDSRTIGFDELQRNVAAYSPELMAPICGIDAETIREVARVYATSNSSMILWGMGVSQHVHGTDNARCLIALALMTGQIGRPGTGLHPLRGQNNVQGASDAGLIPMMYPDYRRVDDPLAIASFEALWGMPLDRQPGLTVVEVMQAIERGEVRGMYIMGENPAMSDPDAEHARAALASLDHLVVQDIFLTETAYLADVVLPASAFPEKTGTFTNTDRTVQLGRQALNPPGQARQDLWIVQQMAAQLGLDWRYDSVEDVFNEMRQAMPSIGGVTWERLEREHAVTYPCKEEGDPGEPVIFTDSFPTATGRGRFVPADIIPAAERPDADYPMVLITGRQLEHWHTGSMTRRAGVLDAIEPDPVALVHPLDLDALGGTPGGVVTLSSRRGEVTLYARADAGTPRGAVFVPFCYYEAAINKLTNAALDPFGKIPEFKYCAIRMTAGGAVPVQSSYGGGQILESASA
ncbi:tugsten containing formate dehydrogenase alpha subunit; 2Fe-2S ferredoxin N-term domain [Cupriavidus taiwanensis]|uniref:Tugsten containing formate dehydrogenase alpha subunit 2Fe-2S ferredoxin N-term domain n=1 Tax=Cupriavidus taiwanensis TaxID=164546 RepID=A0A976G4P1_9BURK|nr:formate dehydrogenase subunit alpha [Cupriavidus taiwanensis]SOZ65449.1 tugsten containing formate dehydrogenase alpha subunit; 2Fe-2S ferredoxin N-term domain [Cupriavidus taiwanensis]SOZ66702.1 tugsten containing formate dehydrogenase alpha subunit; 2Fe-2S ferredoxin N-term domain [Cupriavidus taiwanensis]SOZ70062.1 tugsten containing formate dehydrogenase alpha subunit; 2Fe-2S ferredoxin N-term domain [Cupriavidus taiwanensis]SPA01855.1 tugsten containing formate dehydrogenase alpha subun